MATIHQPPIANMYSIFANEIGQQINDSFRAIRKHNAYEEFSIFIYEADRKIDQVLHKLATCCFYFFRKQFNFSTR
jgi:hypothetical protein